jgi:hypothetical protein
MSFAVEAMELGREGYSALASEPDHASTQVALARQVPKRF